MQQKLKFQRFLVFLLGLVCAIFIVTIFLGRTDMVTVMISRSDGLQPEITLAEQKDNITTMKVSKETFESMEGTMILEEEFDDYLQKVPVVQLPLGTPILKSNLEAKREGGEFPNTIAEYHTIYKIAGASINDLPPGTVPGDKIDVLMILNEDGIQKTSVVMRKVPIYALDSGIWIKVTEREFLQLKLAESAGQYLVILPGQVEVPTCTEEELMLRRTQNIDCITEEDRNLVVNNLDVKQALLNNAFDIGPVDYDRDLSQDDENESKVDSEDSEKQSND